MLKSVKRVCVSTLTEETNALAWPGGIAVDGAERAKALCTTRTIELTVEANVLLAERTLQWIPLRGRTTIDARN